MTKLSSDAGPSIEALMEKFEVRSNPDKIRIRRVLGRLAQAKRRQQVQDMMLDLGIAMEMLLLDDNVNHDQLSLAFRIRGAWFIGESPEERLDVAKQLKEIYKLRSEAAHTGALCAADARKLEAAKQSFPAHVRLAERLCRKMIYNGRPDWTKLVLGAI